MGAADVAAASWDAGLAYLVQFVLVWAVGLVLGWLLPKPKWVERGLRTKALLLSSPPGLWFRRVAVAAHLSLIVREVWRNLYEPGTFRGVLRGAWRTLTTGEAFVWPRPGAAAPPCLSAAAGADAGADAWHVGAADLAEFKWTIEQGGRPEGASEWEPMMQKQWPGCTYTAWRRTLASGKSEYKSVTLSEDATAEEYMDFYLDDDARGGWDSMITETQLLESGGPPGGRGQVVRWLRTFPFAFISQREYVIARRFFRDPDGTLYACTKSVASGAAPPQPGMVRMEAFHSHWRSRTVPCPRGSGRPCTETVLLHFEDFRINDRLARFAVKHGMAGFVKGMIPAVQAFVADRRARGVPPTAEDPTAYCHRGLAVPPAAAPPMPPLAPSSATVSRTESVCSADDAASDRSSASAPGALGMTRAPSMKRLGAMMLASGVAIALARTASTGMLDPAAAAGPSGSSRHGGTGAGAGPGRRAHREGGRHHGHGHRHHRAARGEKPPRPRRRHEEPSEPAAVQA